jgi:23S rRNA pseudouridine2605 synthase
LEIRLQKWLAEAGLCSRRKAEGYIAAGRVKVNGKVVDEPGVKADPEKDAVTLDGKPAVIASQLIYIVLHKPEGVVTTVSDPQGRLTVLDLLPKLPVRIFPVGRLDYDSSGLLLLTNDGGLTQKLTHPRSGVKKVYMVRVKGVPTREALKRFSKGLMMDGRLTAPCEIKLVKKIMPDALVRVAITEGRNRQVRRMCDIIGCPVLSLKRVEMGSLKLGGLPRGCWRYLTPEEVKGLTSPVHFFNETALAVKK